MEKTTKNSRENCEKNFPLTQAPHDVHMHVHGQPIYTEPEACSLCTRPHHTHVRMPTCTSILASVQVCSKSTRGRPWVASTAL